MFVAGYRLTTMMTDEAVCLANGQQPGRWRGQKIGFTY